MGAQPSLRSLRGQALEGAMMAARCAVVLLVLYGLLREGHL